MLTSKEHTERTISSRRLCRHQMEVDRIFAFYTFLLLLYCQHFFFIVCIIIISSFSLLSAFLLFLHFFNSSFSPLSILLFLHCRLFLHIYHCFFFFFIIIISSLSSLSAFLLYLHLYHHSPTVIRCKKVTLDGQYFCQLGPSPSLESSPADQEKPFGDSARYQRKCSPQKILLNHLHVGSKFFDQLSPE